MAKRKTIRVCNATPHRNKAVLLYDDDKYGEGFVISHDLSKSKSTHHQLRKNPVSTDKKPSHISHQLRKGEIGVKGTFGAKRYEGYVFDPKDDEDIDLMYKAKKENKPWDYYIHKKTCHTLESNNATKTRAKYHKYKPKK